MRGREPFLHKCPPFSTVRVKARDQIEGALCIGRNRHFLLRVKSIQAIVNQALRSGRSPRLGYLKHASLAA